MAMIKRATGKTEKFTDAEGDDDDANLQFDQRQMRQGR